MKPFTLFFGRNRQIGTFDITNDPRYALVVNTVIQLRERLLNEEVLRQPFLHIFRVVYEYNTEFPADSGPHDPATDHIPNMSDFRKIRNHPTDHDVVDFLTNSFPDIYLSSGYFGPEDIPRVKTCSEQGESDKAKIEINARLVQLWLQAVGTCHFH
jgi:hypothetical protein